MRGWWWKTPDLISLRAAAATVEPGRETGEDVGRYQRLYAYLRDRYASRVVLTFAEIEDILGFSLPPPARVQHQWWAAPDAATLPTVQSDAWTLASRTASVNLMAQTVLFERETPTHAL